MSTRSLYIASWVAVAVGWLSAFVLGLVAAALSSDRLGNMALICLFACMAGTAAVCVGWIDGVPARALPRADRRRLREERSRIALGVEIKRMEQEAGLQ